MELLDKIKSVKLCLMAHPDNEKYSEFEDRISDLEDIEKALSKYDEILEMLDFINKSFGGGNVITFSEKDINDIDTLIKYAKEI